MKKNLILMAAAGLAVFMITACSSNQSSTQSQPSDTKSEMQSGASDSKNTADDKSDAKGDTSDAGSLQTVKKGKLIMATNAEFPPYEFHEGDDIVGIDAEIAGEIAKKLGLELEIEDVAFSAVIPEVISGKADMVMAGMSVTEERKQNVDFSKTYADTVQVIIVKDNSDIAKPEQLEKKTIGVQEGTTGAILAEDVKDASIESYNKGVDAVQSLIQNKVDAVIIDEETAKALIKDTSGIKILDTAFAKEEYAIAVKKGNKELLTRIDKALAELESEGKIKEIVKKYIKAE